MSVVASYDGKQNFSILNISILPNNLKNLCKEPKRYNEKLNNCFQLTGRKLCCLRSITAFKFIPCYSSSPFSSVCFSSWHPCLKKNLYGKKTGEGRWGGGRENSEVRRGNLKKMAKARQVLWEEVFCPQGKICGFLFEPWKMFTEIQVNFRNSTIGVQ